MDEVLLDEVVKLARKVTGHEKVYVRVQRQGASQPGQEYVAEVLEAGLAVDALWHAGATQDEALRKLRALLQEKS